MLRPVLHFACFVAILGGASAGATGESEPEEPRWAITGFGGVSLNNVWEDVFTAPQDLHFEEAYLAGVAVARVLGEPITGLSFEIEGQLVRHFGSQTHWEVNAPILTARWGLFPWALDTSVAFGLGLSLASETPQLEVENEGDSEAVMAYWMIEVDSELPAENWRIVGRLHHRSPAYGLFGDDGGANALVLGVRRQF
jgi:hypothetical protein